VSSKKSGNLKKIKKETLVRFFNIKRNPPFIPYIPSPVRPRSLVNLKIIKEETLVRFFNIKKKIPSLIPYIPSPGRPRSPANLKK
jgi:hypothetical protein